MAIRLNKIKPMFNRLLVTADIYTYGKNEIAEHSEGVMKEFQTVLAVGGSVRDIKVGDVVNINPARYAVKKRNDNSLAADIAGNNIMSFQFERITVDGKDCILLYDSDINYIAEEYEEVKLKTGDTGIVTPSAQIITP